MSGYQNPARGGRAGGYLYGGWKHISLLRKILLRMRSCENYVFLGGH